MTDPRIEAAQKKINEEKRKQPGWEQEPQRHSLAAKGITTTPTPGVAPIGSVNQAAKDASDGVVPEGQGTLDIDVAEGEGETVEPSPEQAQKAEGIWSRIKAGAKEMGETYGGVQDWLRERSEKAAAHRQTMAQFESESEELLDEKAMRAARDIDDGNKKKRKVPTGWEDLDPETFAIYSAERIKETAMNREAIIGFTAKVKRGLESIKYERQSLEERMNEDLRNKQNDVRAWEETKYASYKKTLESIPKELAGKRAEYEEQYRHSIAEKKMGLKNYQRQASIDISYWKELEGHVQVLYSDLRQKISQHPK